MLRFRKCNTVRPRPAERTLIKPLGEWYNSFCCIFIHVKATALVDVSCINICRSWEDVSWDGRGRRVKVNAVLGSLCRYYYPGMVEVNGVRQAAFQWADWGLKEYVEQGESSSGGGTSEQRRRTCQVAVWEDFWVSSLA